MPLRGPTRNIPLHYHKELQLHDVASHDRAGGGGATPVRVHYSDDSDADIALEQDSNRQGLHSARPERVIGPQYPPAARTLECSYQIQQSSRRPIRPSQAFPTHVRSPPPARLNAYRHMISA